MAQAVRFVGPSETNCMAGHPFYISRTNRQQFPPLVNRCSGPVGRYRLEGLGAPPKSTIKSAGSSVCQASTDGWVCRMENQQKRPDSTEALISVQSNPSATLLGAITHQN